MYDDMTEYDDMAELDEYLFELWVEDNKNKDNNNKGE